MPTIINADDGVVSGVAGLKTSADNSGVLALQTNGTTAVTVNTSQNVGIGQTSITAVGAYRVLEVNGTTGGYIALSTAGTRGASFFGTTSGVGIEAIGASNFLQFYAGNTERMRIPATGGIQSGNCVSVGNATPSTSGAGITFPATQSASTDANTLDDYEEGTFTPTIIGTSTAGTGTYTIQLGRYTKIGNRVQICTVVAWSAHTGSGSMDIGGFPFTSVNVTNLDQIFFGAFSNITYTKTQRYIGLPPNTTRASCGEIDSNSGGTNMPLDTAGYISFTGQYEV